MDWSLYRYRHWVENAFAQLKQYRVIATRYDKLKQNFEIMAALWHVVIFRYLCEMSTDPRKPIKEILFLALIALVCLASCFQ